MSVYGYRRLGQDYCRTEGSKHYQADNNKAEPLDLIIAQGMATDFCLGNVIKYTSRYKRTQNLEDLRKAADYLHILCGIEVLK